MFKILSTHGVFTFHILMESGLMLMLRSSYCGPRPKLMQISTSSVHILSVAVSVQVQVSGSVHEPSDEKFYQK